MRDFNGVIPNDKESFQSLSGVGEYTAGAVISIAFDQPFCAIDGNHRRVLYRYLGLKKKTKRNEIRINSFLKSLVKIDRPGDINQAIMDIGSLKVIRGVQGGIPLYYQGHVVGAIGVSGAKPEIDKAIAINGIENIKELQANK